MWAGDGILGPCLSATLQFGDLEESCKSLSLSLQVFNMKHGSSERVLSQGT